jgi:predicted permease
MLTDRLAARADIESAGAVTQLPMSGAFLGSSFALPAGNARASAVEFGADLRGVTTGYFDTMRIQLVSGRAFTKDDRAESRPVAVIDQTLARRFWPDGDAVGHQLRWVRTGDLIDIVGIVAAVRHYGLTAPPRETVYRPYAQYAAMPEMFVEAQSPRGFETARAAVVEEVRRLDEDQPIADLGRVDALVEASLGQPRFNTLLLAVFAGMALLLAAVGVYGVMAFAVSERTREIGVRMALGADAAAVGRMIVRDGAIMTVFGVGTGVVLALVLARGLRTLLFGVNPWDPGVFLTVTALLAVVALAASYLPARRAARLDPTVALRA